MIQSPYVGLFSAVARHIFQGGGPKGGHQMPSPEQIAQFKKQMAEQMERQKKQKMMNSGNPNMGLGQKQQSENQTLIPIDDDELD